VISLALPELATFRKHTNGTISVAAYFVGSPGIIEPWVLDHDDLVVISLVHGDAKEAGREVEGRMDHAILGFRAEHRQSCEILQ